jgi:hypothetical protein
MQDMPRPRPPYLHREITRHGKTVWYVRKGKGARIRLSAPFGSEEFERQYQAALLGTVPPARAAAPSAGTLAWAVSLYRGSSAWLALSNATRRQRENIFRKVLASADDERLKDISRVTIAAGRERRNAGGCPQFP